jgi:hypothetical protein
MKLISGAGKAWRLFSVQVGAVAVVFGTLPAEMQTAILDALSVPANRVPAVLGAVFMAARLVQQGPA